MHRNDPFDDTRKKSPSVCWTVNSIYCGSREKHKEIHILIAKCWKNFVFFLCCYSCHSILNSSIWFLLECYSFYLRFFSSSFSTSTSHIFLYVSDYMFDRQYASFRTFFFLFRLVVYSLFCWFLWFWLLAFILFRSIKIFKCVNLMKIVVYFKNTLLERWALYKYCTRIAEQQQQKRFMLIDSSVCIHLTINSIQLPVVYNLTWNACLNTTLNNEISNKGTKNISNFGQWIIHNKQKCTYNLVWFFIHLKFKKHIVFVTPDEIIKNWVNCAPFSFECLTNSYNNKIVMSSNRKQPYISFSLLNCKVNIE